MTTSVNSSSKTILFIIAFLGWFALTTQLVLLLHAHVASTAETIIRYFSFFTILTNLLVAIYSTVNLFIKSATPPLFFSKPNVATAIAVYIAVVGLVYNIVLRFLWTPEGMQQLVDELLHTFIPIAFVAYWFFFVAKKELSWTSFIPWLIYPFVYCLYILVQGALSNFYPYPFMDVSTLGYGKVLMNSLIVTTVFLGFSLLFIGIGRKTNAK